MQPLLLLACHFNEVESTANAVLPEKVINYTDQLSTKSLKNTIARKYSQGVGYNGAPYKIYCIYNKILLTGKTGMQL